MRVLAVLLVVSTCTAACAADFDPWTQSARYELEYSVDLTALLAGGNGALRLWLPLPVNNGAQRLVSTVVQSPWEHREARDRLGNRFVYVEPMPLAAGNGEPQIVLRPTVQSSLCQVETTFSTRRPW